MINWSARCKTGHFFHKLLIFSLVVLAGAGCNSEQTPSLETMELPKTGATAILIQFQDISTDGSMPEAAADLASTSCGRIHAIQENINCFRMIAEEADSSGKLLFLIIPEAEHFSGIRDHLVIRINSSGVPVEVSPELDLGLLADSLWDDPIIRQQTILDLVFFFKPDIVLQIVPESRSSLNVTEFWSEHGAYSNITVALFALPSEGGRSRGWAIFTGKGIQNGLLEGLDIRGFITTFQMISGLNWNKDVSGYPAMQAFYTHGE